MGNVICGVIFITCGLLAIFHRSVDVGDERGTAFTVKGKGAIWIGVGVIIIGLLAVFLN